MSTLHIHKKVSDKATRFVLIQRGYIKPKFGNRVDQQPGNAVAVRRVDDRPVTRQIKVTYA